MNTILAFQSPKDHYIADACVVWCFDDRFSGLLAEFVQKENLKNVDLVKIAGGSKGLSGNNQDSDYAYLVDQIQKSIALHHTKRVILMKHDACGAFGGETDHAFYEGKLKEARLAVQKEFPNVRVDALFATFDGLKQVA